MSTALGIAAVTAVLRDVIDNGLKAHKVGDVVGGDVTVSALAPDRIALGAVQEPAQLNLFLYQVTPNPGWRNHGLPSRDSRGDRIANSILALDLHYLLTAYSSQNFYPEVLLGHAMQLLHETSVIPRATVRKALAPVAPPGDLPAALKTSELAEQVEQITVTSQPLSLDEMSKLWSAVNSHYRPTAAYLVTVVLIEGKRPTRSALPVLRRHLEARQLRQPQITRLSSDAGEGQPLTIASTLIVEGLGLAAEHVGVWIGGVDVTTTIQSAADTRVEVSLAGAADAGVRAGPQTVQVVHSRELGDPPTPRSLTESNAEAFVLCPEIEAQVTKNVADGKDNGINVRAGEIALSLTPKVTSAQRTVLLLNQIDIPAGVPPRAYSFSAPAGNGIVAPETETDTVTVPFRRVVPGKYLVRARVDGAESTLITDADDVFSEPQVTI